MRKILAALLLTSAIVSLAHAQTSPNLSYGQVLTAGQWNAILAGKNDTLGYTPLNSAGGVMLGRLVTAPPGSTTAGLNLTPGTAPASPVNGDIWTTAAGIYAQINGATIGPLSSAEAAAFAATSPLAVSFAGALTTYALNFNSSLVKDGGNNLGINLGNANIFTATQTFPNNSLTLAEFPTIGTNTVLGSVAGGTPAALSQAQLTSFINAATASLSGALPAWPNNTTTFFRGDGTYAALNFAALGGAATLGQLPAGVSDTALGYWGSTTASALAINNCSNALTYSTSTHAFGCNTTAGTGNVVSSGTPTANQIAQWTNATTIQGVNLASLLTAGSGITITGTTSPTIAVNGGWVLLNTLTASNSATLSDITSITASYNEYELVFENILPATTSVSCEIQVHMAGIFETSGYSSQVLRAQGATVAGTAVATYIPCGDAAGALVNTGTGVSGTIIVFKPSQTASPKMWSGTFFEDNTPIAILAGGALTGINNAVDGFQVLMSSGNITSGTIKVYGRL